MSPVSEKFITDSSGKRIVVILDIEEYNRILEELKKLQDICDRVKEKDKSVSGSIDDVLFNFRINKSFLVAPHPITIPRKHYDIIHKQLDKKRHDIEIRCNTIRAKGWICYGVAGWGELYQIRTSNKLISNLFKDKKDEYIQVKISFEGDIVRVELVP